MTSPPPDLSADVHLHFVTGRLAEAALASQVKQAAERAGFAYSIGVAPITVAALITPKWLTRHLAPPTETTHVILPGYCAATLDQTVETAASQSTSSQSTSSLKNEPEKNQTQATQAETWRDRLASIANVPGPNVLCGPNDCRDLEAWLGGKIRHTDLSEYAIEIIAEINHAPRMSVDAVVRIADRLRGQGADRIDLGCDPGRACETIDQYVDALIDAGHRISIDTFDPREAAIATSRGASLVLSVNSSNREHAPDWGCEVVAIPDTPDDLASLDATISFLSAKNVPMRLDPILEPIGSGFGASLIRYAEVRRRYPELPMMMGIGNLTELTDVDSAGVNFLLLGFCEEFRVESVLTTQVINWARSSVKECDLARRLVHHAVANRVPPKRLSDELVMLRDAKLRPYAPEWIDEFAAGLRDNNYRIFAQDDAIHLISAGVHLTGRDPFAMMDELLEMPQSDNVDVSHAFYLGYELAKARIAMQLGKQYDQDQALRWGHLTEPEKRHRIKRVSRHRDSPKRKRAD